MTKAIVADGDQLQYSLNLAMSRRGILKVYSDRLECGDWVIMHQDITDAVLTSIRSALFLPGYVLRVNTRNRTYHLGLNGGRFWKSDLPFEVIREKEKLGYSKFSIVARVLVIVFLCYWVWKKFL